MASTSTNKQPLLVDRVLHVVTDLSGSTVEYQAGVTIGGSNNASLIVDCTTNDGAIIEEIYSIARTVTAAYKINLYLSSASDYLRQQQSVFIGSFLGSTTEGTKTTVSDMPKILAPMPQTGSDEQYRALYLPRGKALWAAVEQAAANDQAVNAPILGVQGGFY